VDTVYTAVPLWHLKHRCVLNVVTAVENQCVCTWKSEYKILEY